MPQNLAKNTIKIPQKWQKNLNKMSFLVHRHGQLKIIEKIITVKTL